MDDRTIGRGLLRATGTLDMAHLVNPTGVADCACLGDAGLSAHGLGRNFVGVTGGWFPWPLISRPDPVTAGEITGIALAWARWALDESKIQTQRPVLDFMRNIVSEASATTQIRDGRIAANFFVGVERLAIFIVSTFLVFCLLW